VGESRIQGIEDSSREESATRILESSNPGIPVSGGESRIQGIEDSSREENATRILESSNPGIPVSFELPTRFLMEDLAQNLQ
jgi:hypothetical protein